MDKALKSFNLTLAALVFACLPGLVGAETCYADNEPLELANQIDRLMEGDYPAFFKTLAQPTPVGPALSYSESDVATVESVYPSGFQNCALLLDKSTSDTHRRQLFVLYGNGYGIFLYWEAFQLADQWQIWDYRLSTSFPEIRQKMD